MVPAAASIANLQYHPRQPSFIFTCSDAITDSNVRCAKALRLLLPLPVSLKILPPSDAPAVEIKGRFNQLCSHFYPV